MIHAVSESSADLTNGEVAGRSTKARRSHELARDCRIPGVRSPRLCNIRVEKGPLRHPEKEPLGAGGPGGRTALVHSKGLRPTP